MNMKEAAARLGKIIAKLGGGTSKGDEDELRALHAEMTEAAGDAAPKAKPRKARATATPRTVKPLKSEPVAKGKLTKKAARK